MKFNCIHCGKKYGISDEKLKRYGSVFKMRCQSCKNILSIDNPHSEKKESAKKWYIYLSGEQIGPMTLKELISYKNRGLKFSTLIWKVGMKDWKQAQFIPDLKDVVDLPIKASMRKARQKENLNKLYKESKAKIERKNIKAEEAKRKAEEAKQKADDARRRAEEAKLKEEKLKLENAKREAEKIKRLNQIKSEDNEKLFKEEQVRIAKEKKAIEETRLEIEKIKKEAEKAKKEAEEAKQAALKEVEEALKEAEEAKEAAKLAKEVALKEAEEARENAKKETEEAKQELERLKRETSKIPKTPFDEDEESMISADEFFDSDFEEKKATKDERMLRSLKGDSEGNTGVFIMYNQKRKKERILFFSLIAIIFAIFVPIIVYFYDKEPEVKTITKVETITKDRIIIKKEKEYVEIKNNKKNNKKYVNVKKDDKKDDKDIKDVKKVTKTKKDLYGGRTFNTKKDRVAIKDTKNDAKTASNNQEYTNMVAKVVGDSKRGLFWCYRKELKNEPDIMAKVYFKLKISESGRVTSTTVTFKPKKYNESNMSNCMNNKVKNWKFPANPNGEPINFNFNISLQAN